MILGVAFAGITCLISITAVVFAAIAAVLKTSTPSIRMLNVADVPAVLHTTMLVTTVVVLEFGTVYKVPELVANAARASTLDVAAIVSPISSSGH